MISSEEIIPFGCFKGSAVGEVPSSYLRFLVREVRLERWLEQAILEELADRKILQEVE